MWEVLHFPPVAEKTWGSETGDLPEVIQLISSETRIQIDSLNPKLIYNHLQCCVKDHNTKSVKGPEFKELGDHWDSQQKAKDWDLLAAEKKKCFQGRKFFKN